MTVGRLLALLSIWTVEILVGIPLLWLAANWLDVRLGPFATAMLLCAIYAIVVISVSTIQRRRRGDRWRWER